MDHMRNKVSHPVHSQENRNTVCARSQQIPRVIQLPSQYLQGALAQKCWNVCIQRKRGKSALIPGDTSRNSRCAMYVTKTAVSESEACVRRIDRLFLTPLVPQESIMALEPTKAFQIGSGACFHCRRAFLGRRRAQFPHIQCGRE